MKKGPAARRSAVFDLSAFCVHVVAVPVDQFGNRNDLIALPLQVGDQLIQGFRRKFCAVMA